MQILLTFSTIWMASQSEDDPKNDNTRHRWQILARGFHEDGKLVKTFGRTIRQCLLKFLTKQHYLYKSQPKEIEILSDMNLIYYIIKSLKCQRLSKWIFKHGTFTHEILCSELKLCCWATFRSTVICSVRGTFENDVYYMIFFRKKNQMIIKRKMTRYIINHRGKDSLTGLWVIFSLLLLLCCVFSFTWCT